MHFFDNKIFTNNMGNLNNEVGNTKKSVVKKIFYWKLAARP